MSITISTQNEDLILKYSTLQPWFVCLSAALFFFYEFIQMGMFNSLAPELMRDFNLSATQAGNLSATYFYADVIFLLLAGVLVDRFSVRKIILSAGILCTIATAVFALSTSVLLAGISHFVSGIGNAFCFLSCIKLSSRWFSSRRLALIISITITVAMMGGVVAQAPLTFLAQAIGWRHAVLIDALLGVLIVIINWYFVQDHPPASDNTEKQTNLEIVSSQSKLRFALLNSQNWLGGIYTCLLNLPIFLLGELWGVMYLVQTQHVSRLQASYITTMIFVGTIIGSPLVGWFSDHIGRRRVPMILGAILSLITILIIMFVPGLNAIALLLLFLILGIFTSAQIISYPAIAESNPKVLTGTASGLAAVLIMGGGAVFQPLFGWLMDLHWNKTIINNVAIYSHADFMRGMMIVPIAFAVGLIAALLIRETYCQPYKEQ